MNKLKIRYYQPNGTGVNNQPIDKDFIKQHEYQLNIKYDSIIDSVNTLGISLNCLVSQDGKSVIKCDPDKLSSAFFDLLEIVNGKH